MNNDPSIILSSNEIIAQFREAMAEQGIETQNEIFPTGKIQRFHVDGDAQGSKNGWYVLHYDEKPAGLFGCNKRYGDHKFPWQANQQLTKPWTPEEKAAWATKVAKERAEKLEAEKARLAKAAARAKQLWEAAKPADDSHPYLVAKGVKNYGLRIGRWEKIDYKSGEINLISDNALFIPVQDKKNNIHSLEAIFPQKLESMGNRNKDYLFGGGKQGHFFPIGKMRLHNNRPVLILVEGYATGATVYEATSHLVLVCFDAGNLPTIAKEIRASMKAGGKDAIIIIAADNDQWTIDPIKNPGVHHATIAAQAADGILLIPQFKDLTTEPTDFNDLCALEGIEAVKAVFDAALNPPEPPQPIEETPWENEPPKDIPTPSEPIMTTESAPKAPAVDEYEDELIKNSYFTILGYDGPNYFLFLHEQKQVRAITKSDLTDTGLLEFAPLQWWQENFPGEKKSINKKMAANWLFRQANARGIYDPTRQRGRGAWKDKGRYIFHHGDHLTVDGVATEITRISSAYVYPMGRVMPEPAPVMMSAEEGKHLIDVCKMIRWTKPASAELLAGWVMLSPICGALKWRPHIWLTGAAGSGKTTVQVEFCCMLTSGFNVYAQGNSSEPGIRQELRGDALPVLIEEAESSDPKERARMDSVLAMIRQSSSESPAKTLKGTTSGSSMRFSIRSMFCLASINTYLEKKADVDRLTKLVIKPPAIDGSSEAHWKNLSEELHKISLDESISSRLLARALSNLPTILANVDIFTHVAAKIFSSQREGDQFGTLMAGSWSLGSDAIATEEQAAALINSYNWTEHVEDNDQDDASRALEVLMGAKIRMGNFGDLTVYELIREMSPSYRVLTTISEKECDAALRRHGIRVDRKTDEILFGTGVTNLKQLVEKSNFVTDLRGQLLRLPDATRYNDKSMRFNGHASKCVSIKLSNILDDEDKRADDESPL